MTRMIEVENVDLEKFEHLVYEKKYEEAGQELLIVLKRLRQGAEFVGYPIDESWRISLYTRLAGAITALFVDPEFKPSLEGYKLITSYHPIINAIFSISGYQTADHILKLIGTIKDGTINWDGQYPMLKLLMCYTLDSQIDIDFETIFKSNPQETFPAWLGMVSHGINLDKLSEERHTKLIEMHEIFEDVEPEDYFLSAMSDAYMHCSYSTSENRHVLKKTLNKVFKKSVIKTNSLKDVKRNDECARCGEKGHDATFHGACRICGSKMCPGCKPTIVCLLERFSSTHAMFRVYGESLRNLQEKFSVVGITTDEEIDDVAKEIFDEVKTFPGDNLNIKSIIDIVNSYEPDIIYYPSIGMSVWTQALSTVRLAPVQIMSPGHPATTYSDAIDYCIVDDLWQPKRHTHSEKIIVKRGMKFIDPENYNPPKHVFTGGNKVAVPGMLCKLNASIMETLFHIKERTGCKFEFFPNMSGVSHWYAVRLIRQWIPDAVVHERSDFDTYLKNLSLCDMALGTFPFTGTNTTYDILRVGLPMVSMKGDEIFARTDYGVLSNVGLKDLVVETKEDYINLACDLIVNVDKRKRICNYLNGCEVNQMFVEDDKLSDVIMRLWEYQQ